MNALPQWLTPAPHLSANSNAPAPEDEQDLDPENPDAAWRKALILRHEKPAQKKNQVLFINGERLFKRGRNQNTLEPENAQQVLDTYQAYADVDGLSRVVDLDEIAGNDYNLNIPLYIAPADAGENLTLAQALADLEAAHQRATETRAALEAELAKWGLGQEVTA